MQTAVPKKNLSHRQSVRNLLTESTAAASAAVVVAWCCCLVAA